MSTRSNLHATAIRTLREIQMSKLDIRMDITTLDMMIAFLYKDSVLRTRKALSNIDKLMKSINMSLYKENETDLTNRIWIIQKTLDARLREGLVNDDIIQQYCKDAADSDPYKEDIINATVAKSNKITHEESKYLLKQVDDRLRFGYTITLKHTIEALMDLIDETDIRSYKSIAEDLYQIASSIIAIRRSTNSADSDQTFSLQEDVFQTVVDDALERLKNRNRIFVTGIRHLNTFLAPGYMSKRLYTYLALPGGGKSLMLLQAALDIRRYNGDIQCKNPDNRPAILFITMENSIEETVERIFNMVSVDDDIRNFTSKQVQRMLREDGQLKLTDRNNIDIIIKYYDNRSIDTNDLHGLIQDLEDDGIEVIALILDYLKRIRPAEKGKDEKEELKNITNELKSLANHWDIPVITAQQLNRNAASVIDAAIQAKKEDVLKLVGRDGVAGAWEIVENSDVVIIINKEKKADTGEVFMTFKLLKRRYRSAETDPRMRQLEYFNHPYVKGSDIKLVQDIELDESVSLTSLASQFVAVDTPSTRGSQTSTERKKKTSDDDLYETDPFLPFDIDQNVYN